ncbi:hypothetical protein Lpp221_00695 [Lacticaseibacillus paracasei subsp. paracasei Lpp221]|uniref:Uncharacterized protein n=2 Tax=Lacticaseibacillus paracasei subsp. paracasei TaxID=47714 RepID=S2NTV8_LACPA|nr:hypothetical protein [Lacticaseibacillus paracasei]EPC26127.1 hypothetical protein Lpp17_1158 [Lacticaseibacillus paracasei subsp. paracasei Lpp17]EPC27704.1 hypothetical protein Lpp46_0781 [Lacticaseibacillus paracasei subsp. paracasei Lpp46]EPC38131.1 hypothetical protein Lpp225_1240 [Lacticaseibacillus paracasei subsp. paracasei Lpp225]EPC80566.1 hypothetical protein Lpp221_00695 [Lacticaseibacillus paracasei subsp. paracasei Lpp221]EPD10257.1 hypothetical protein Lpp48_10896 [Lacticasei
MSGSHLGVVINLILPTMVASLAQAVGGVKVEPSFGIIDVSHGMFFKVITRMSLII